jgi:phospholipid/cholesterol/gamma-HCH transport system substrate-binding protein
VSQARRNATVGIFVLAGIFLGGLVIFLIGDERRLFAPEKTFKSSFADVSGLKPGAPVRMGGIDIGHVTDVGYDVKSPKDTTIYVKFEVVTSESGRIRKDSKVRISTKGLLGDKVIEVTRGSETAESMPPNSYIESEVAPDMFSNVSDVAEQAKQVMGNLNRATEPLGNEQLHKDIREAVAALNAILQSIAHGNGYAHKLLSDDKEAERISHILDNVDKATNELNLTLHDTRNVIARVQYGPGFTHEVIYGDGPKEQIQQFGNAAQELALTLQGVRTNESLAHDLLYGGKGDTAQALANINAVTGDFRAIVADIRAGKGTIGGLLVDPSIYEDVKTVLGNVQRNDVLRALVRFSIKQDEKKPEVEVAK